MDTLLDRASFRGYAWGRKRYWLNRLLVPNEKARRVTPEKLKNSISKPFFERVALPYMSVITLFFVTIFVLYPRPAEAGFFSAILRLFGGVSSAETVNESTSAELAIPLMGSQATSPTPAIGGAMDEDIVLISTQENALVSTRNPLGTIPRATTDQITVYRVEPGDTPGAIAERFGISLQTLLWANDLRSAGTIKVGDDLIILPVTGVQYEVKRGDTLESIAKKFKGDAAEITAFNGLAIGEALTAGQVVIIPDGEFAPPPAPAAPKAPQTRIAAVPDYKGFYMRPIIGGRKSRGIHGYNGVDLANSCGIPVMASAPGTVIIARTGGWNGGYGLYVVIAHANNTQTLYAHLSSLAVKSGDLLSQGQYLGTLGSTGNSTGCHVHFEIRGAKNPF